MRKKKYDIKIKQLLVSLIIIITLIIIYSHNNKFFNDVKLSTNQVKTYSEIVDIPEYNGEIYVTINNNMPYFNENEYITVGFEKYSELDELGRCGVAYVNVCKDIMPSKVDKRGDISSVKPTGWKQKKYDGKYLYNRCHLIGYQLANENANELNLITGTSYFNVSGMLPFENSVAEYINENINNHVLYRVTPVFKDKNLLASRC